MGRSPIIGLRTSTSIDATLLLAGEPEAVLVRASSGPASVRPRVWRGRGRRSCNARIGGRPARASRRTSAWNASLARTGSRTGFGIGPAFPPGRVSGSADGGVDGRRSLGTSWLRQRQSAERSLRTECAANRVQFAAGCRAGTSAVGGFSAMPGERHLAGKAPSLSGAVSDDCVAATGRQVSSTSGVYASVGSQSSQDYFPSGPRGA